MDYSCTSPGRQDAWHPVRPCQAMCPADQTILVRIFEGSGEEDCLRLLVGQVPNSKTGPVLPSSTTLPLSPYYARVLADLAQQRGFDGYLLNFECPLQGGIEQTRALAGWITILRAELETKVGTHAQVIWYFVLHVGLEYQVVNSQKFAGMTVLSSLATCVGRID